MGDSAHLIGTERDQAAAVVDAVVTATDADATPAAVVGSQHHGPDHRIEAGGIPATSRDCYAHRWTNRSTLLFKDAPLARPVARNPAAGPAKSGGRPGALPRPAPLDHGTSASA